MPETSRTPADARGPAPIPVQPLAPARAKALPPRLFAGTSGWAYPSWKPGFYPADVSAKRFLGYYGTQLNSVEVNHTFTKPPEPGRVAAWCAEVGPGFRFSFKAPQRITHWSRLVDCEAELDAFFTALAAAAGRMGCVLFQLPPNFKADPARLRDFLSLPAFQAPGAPPAAFEFRHASWFADPCLQLLADRSAALCVAETDDLQTPEVHTVPGIACFRLRRDGGYSTRELGRFRRRFQELARTRDVYAYFRHQEEPAGALNARELLHPVRRSGTR